MPYEVRQVGNRYCVYKKDGGERLGCHGSKAAAERQMRAIGMATHEAGLTVEQAEGFDGWLTVEAIQELCPDCADTMEANGLKAIDLFAIERIPAGLREGLCRKFSPDPGFFSRCMRSSLGGYQPGSKEGFCANLHKYCTGIYPGQHSAELVFDEFENYVSVRPGEPYRWMPFGDLYKDGKLRKITPEFARTFKLPPWKPPIKVGGHKEETPAGGHIAGFEIRDDGIYIIPELVPSGEAAFAEGSFKYHSPEVIWEGQLEDHKTGEMIEGPFIMGDALLHNPHLGEDAALFVKETETISKEKVMETVQVPTSLWDKFMAWFDNTTEPETPGDPEIPEEYKAAVAERDDFKAKYEALENERKADELMATVRGEFATDEFGAAFKGLPEKEGLLDILAALPEDKRAVIVEQFKALSAQIDESALTEEVGSEGGNDDPVKAYNAAILAKATELKTDYNSAKKVIDAEQPALVEAYEAANKRGA